ncbi:MAG: arginase family protein [Nonomuraea sp.]|nr:arginase family protein [Nonomuraea sp.]
MSILSPDRDLVVLDAPTNLGLTPPAPDTVPGVYKAPWALRETGLLERLGARDGGVVVPPRYVATWQLGDGVRNGQAIAAYTRKLADRITAIRASGGFPVVLGGDCSILLGSALSLRREGRYGVAYLDAHSDFRHLGNSGFVRSAAGEDVALATGRGDDYLVDIDGLKPYVRDEDVILLGVRDPEDLGDHDGVLTHVTSADIGGAVEATAKRMAGLDGFWVHVDADVLDPSIMSAVDSPTPGGLDQAQATSLLADLLALPGAAGLQVTIYDPDLDEDGSQARLLSDVIVDAMSSATEGRPAAG